jgi:hypothetical protein
MFAYEFEYHSHCDLETEVKVMSYRPRMARINISEDFII